MGKKIIFKILILVVILIASTLFVAANPVAKYKVILPNTNLYATTDINSEVIAVLPQNAVVLAQGESCQVGEFIWQKVEYNTIEGYVLTHDLYESKEVESYTIKRGKARSAKLGEDINLYISNDIESEIAVVCHDGENINIIMSQIDYGDFLPIEYKGSNYFALKSNVSTSLSLNEMIALIIGSAATVIAITIIIVFITMKNRKLYKETT